MLEYLEFLSNEATYKFLALQAVCVLSAWVIASRDREDRIVA
jgi:hypothetical protein